MKSNRLLLQVPLVCLTFSIAEAAQQEPSSVPLWQQSERTNAVDDFAFSRFTLVGKFLTPLHDVVPNRPALVVDCIPAGDPSRSRGTFLASNLLVGTALKIVYVEPEEIRGINYFPMIAVRFHTDNAKDQ